MIVKRVEQQIIRKSHPLWETIDEMCFNAKNLYNYALYIIRQEYIEHKRYIPYKEMNFNLKTHRQYKDCMSQPANCILRLLDKNWKSFFVAIKDWSNNPNKYLGRPKLPKYKAKDGRFILSLDSNKVKLKDGWIHFALKPLIFLNFATTIMSIKKRKNFLKLRFFFSFQ